MKDMLEIKIKRMSRSCCYTLNLINPFVKLTKYSIEINKPSKNVNNNNYYKVFLHFMVNLDLC